MGYNSPQVVHFDSMLTGISVGFENLELVGNALAPTVTVPKQSDKYYTFTRREGWAVFDDLRAPGARANELPPMTLSRDAYFAEDHSLVGIVPVEETENADAGLDPYADTTEQVTNSILIAREDAIATLARTAANYASANTTTLSGTAQWNDYTNSNPQTDLQTGREAVFAAIQREPNVAVMGRQVYTQLENHPKIVDRVKYTNGKMLTRDIIASFLGVKRLIVGSAMKDTANPGASAATLSFVWGKDVVFAYVPERPGRRTPAFMYEFVWPYKGQAQTTERWFDIDHKVDKIRVSRRYDLKGIALDASSKFIGGYLIKNAVA